MNFGWEYVWHCHILSHEEMDMMRPQSAAVPPIAPTGLTATLGAGGVGLSWADNSKNETGFVVRRALAAGGPWTDVATVAANVTNYTDAGAIQGQINFYQVIAINKVGYSGPALQPGAYSTLQVSSASNVAQIKVPLATPAAPTGLTAVYQAGPQVLLAWTDNATNETGFVVQRCTGATCTNFAPLATPGPFAGTGTVNYTDTTVAMGNTYRYRVAAVNTTVQSGWSNIATVAIPNVPAAPSNVTVSCRLQGNNARCTLVWVDNSNNETNFRVQRSRNANFVGGGLTTVNLGANVTSWAPNNNLPRNTNHYFRVRAFNANGASAWVNATPFPIRTP